MLMTSQKRRQFLVNPRFQMKFVLAGAGLALLAVAIFYACNSYFFNNFTARGENAGFPADHVFFIFLNEQKATMVGIFTAFAAIAVATLSLIAFAISFRFARLINEMALEKAMDMDSAQFDSESYQTPLRRELNEKRGDQDGLPLS